MFEHANFIEAQEDFGTVCPVFYKTFSLPKVPVKAVLAVSALGVYEAALNTSPVGEFFLAPGWTAYSKRLQYQEYEVTSLLQKDNRLELTVGKGWMWGEPVRHHQKDYPETHLAVIAQLFLKYQDGTVETLVTDDSWQAVRSRIVDSDIYDGEIFDATQEPGLPSAVKIFPQDKSILLPQEGEEIRDQGFLEPVACLTTPKGETVLDFGQNLTGFVSFSVCAKKGDVVELSHAEVLDKDGNFYTENYRSAKAKVRYTCREGEQTYRAHFSFYGFRYVRVDQFPGEVTLKHFRAHVVYSALQRTGNLSFPEQPLLEQLFHNIIWGQKSNFLDVPTDCPQRDERLGWTGDAQVFIRTASYNFDVEKFFRKWLADLAADQLEDGLVPHVIPNVLGPNGASAAWGDAACVCPWQLYETYGSESVLEKQFPSMQKWVDYITAHTKEPALWTGCWHFGDWLGLDAPAGSYKGSSREDLIASAFYAYSTSLLIKAGEVLGKDMTAYRTLYQQIVEAFRKEFPEYHTQTEHVLALYFDLAQDKTATAASLAKMVTENGDRLTTGFVGTPYLLHALSDNGYTELAYSLLLQEAFPSWLFSAKMGATTMWEHWDGIREDGSFWSKDMNSYNHYAYGSVADWLYGTAAGIRPMEPGFAKVLIAPHPDRRLGRMGATLETRHGHISVFWYYEGDQVFYSVTVPVASVIRLNGEDLSVEPGDYRFVRKAIL